MDVFDEKRVLAEILSFNLSELGDFYLVGSGDVTRIVLSADGFGPMGHYSQFHVFKGDVLTYTYPAHLMFGWTYKGKDNQ